MSDRLCIIYEVKIRPVNSSSQIASDFYPTKSEAVEAAHEENCRAYRLEIRGEGGLRKAVCRLAKHQGFVGDREKIADFSDLQPAEPFEGVENWNSLSAA